MHIFHSAAVLGAAGNNINPCGVDVGMTQNIRKLGYVLLNAVEHSRKQVPQVVRKHLSGIDIRFFAERFHLPPNVGAADGFTRFCDEDHAGFNCLFRCIAEQFSLQLFYNKN